MAENTTKQFRCPAHWPLSRILARFSSPSPDGCLLWLRGINTGGYGHFKRRGKMRLAHRCAWEVENGHIPEGMLVLHKCDVRSCVNPDHLFLGTNADNAADRNKKGRSAFGERHPGAVLTKETALAIRASTASGSALAKQYGVTRQQIWHVRHRKQWGHV